jgi:two-component system, sensor histidine kinase and response regulator
MNRPDGSTVRKILPTSDSQFLLFDQWTMSGEPIMTIIHNTPSGICITDEQGFFEYVNPAYCAIYGYPLAELIGKHFTIVVPVPSRSWLIELHDKFIAGTKEVRGEWPVRNKAGEELFILADAIRIIGLDGRPKKVTFITDITARKKIEDELCRSEVMLREAVATKDKFFSIIAHDLGNSFTVINVGANLLVSAAQETGSEGVRSCADILCRATHAAMELMNDLFTWARSQTGTLACHPVELQLCSVVHRALLPLREVALGKGITIIVTVPEDLTLRADPDMLSTVIHNLLGNALKFSLKGKSVQIAAWSDASLVTVSVSDSGVGIEGDDLGTLFSVGNKHSSKGTEGERGTGLGLVLCREFVETHNGRIWAESEAGAGSTFSFSLPLVGPK